MCQKYLGVKQVKALIQDPYKNDKRQSSQGLSFAFQEQTTVWYTLNFISTWLLSGQSHLKAANGPHLPSEHLDITAHSSANNKKLPARKFSKRPPLFQNVDTGRINVKYGDKTGKT